jgi:L-lactate dehydrogenase complex protein LldF
MTGIERQFQSDARAAANDFGQRGRIRNSMRNYAAARSARVAQFQDWQAARVAASAIKREAIDRLDEHLASFADRVESRGGRVFFADDSAEAREYVLRVIRRRGAKRIVKSKTMTSEEIHLNEALEHAGCEVIESDLGEYIVQLLKETPFHFVFPAMHLSRGQIADLFRRELHAACTDDPAELTMIARRVLRQLYASADVGISGANFAIAETGMISITENEGNARLTTSLPPVHIALVGIEKVLPRMSDLALLLPMLATSGTGQALTCYNSLISGPRRAGEPDGPVEFHVILLDNGRSALLSDAEQRDALHCIRCGACLNVCPVFNTIGGHAYGSTYQGPIGSVITPHLRGLKQWGHLSHASSLCGACTDICPVKIDLHHHLIHNRRNRAAGDENWRERSLYRLFAAAMNRPWLYRLAGRIGRWTQAWRDALEGTRFDPLRGWSTERRLPPLAGSSFRDLWHRRTSRG